MPGLVDDAHAAPADLRDDLVTRHGQPAGTDRWPLARTGVAEPSSVVSSPREDLDRPGFFAVEEVPLVNIQSTEEGVSSVSPMLGDGISTVSFMLGDSATIVSAGGVALAWMQVQGRRRGRRA